MSGRAPLLTWRGRDTLPRARDREGSGSRSDLPLPLAGGDRAAIALTILGCCRLAAVDPVEYLRDVLPRLARRVRLCDVPALLPAAWKAARAIDAPAS